ncbi:hypothetical protein TanjilG_15338 [Lupinus angustifolius]|uniref:Uncharacterized protein n=1 Tax=Lupinus angustifolius TaxID=3871 RepID=A0A1J7HAK4_LUPAN|nr:hypothetical protein TanjilG_15338 [Lupinus angustifolius]
MATERDEPQPSRWLPILVPTRTAAYGGSIGEDGVTVGNTDYHATYPFLVYVRYASGIVLGYVCELFILTKSPLKQREDTNKVGV